MSSHPIAAVMIHTPQPDEALVWYQRAFPRGVSVRLGEPEFPALVIGDMQLEFVPADAKGPAGPGGTVVYWKVAFFEPELERLLSLGATLYRGPMKVEDGQTMCQLRDPWGNCMGLRGRADSPRGPA